MRFGERRRREKKEWDCQQRTVFLLLFVCLFLNRNYKDEALCFTLLLFFTFLSFLLSSSLLLCFSIFLSFLLLIFITYQVYKRNSSRTSSALLSKWNSKSKDAADNAAIENRSLKNCLKKKKGKKAASVNCNCAAATRNPWGIARKTCYVLRQRPSTTQSSPLPPSLLYTCIGTRLPWLSDPLPSRVPRGAPSEANA